MVKYEKFTLETNKRFDEVDEAFVELEKEHETLNCCDTSLVDVNVSNVNSVNDSAIVSGNLKSVIEQELADSANL